MATKKKKTIQKNVKKSAPKKATKKAVKKTAAKPAKKTVKKTLKASPKKTAKKPVKKTAAPQAAKKVQSKAPAKKAAPKITTAKIQMAPFKAQVVDYSKAITPLLDRLVVRVVQGERQTAGGLIIPDTASMVTGYIKGEVLAVGQGGKNKKGHVKPMDVQVGDQVLFAEYAGTKVQFHSEELQIIHESDVMGILQN